MEIAITTLTSLERMQHLPHRQILNKLYQKKIIHLSPLIQKKILDRVQKGESILPLVSSFSPDENKSLVKLGILLYKFSPDGKETSDKLFKEILKISNPDALFSYANALAKGSLGTPQLELSMDYIQKLAQKNHPEALYVLGMKHLKSKNRAQALLGLQYIQSAANFNDPNALYQLGLIHKQKGEWNQCLDYFLKSSDLGKLEACFEVGNLYFSNLVSDSSKSNHQLAFEYYKKSAEKGVSMAQHNLGSFYMQGIHEKTFFMKPNSRFAIEYWKMAAFQRNALSIVNLAKYYLYEAKDVQQAKYYIDLVQTAEVFDLKRDLERLQTLK